MKHICRRNIRLTDVTALENTSVSTQAKRQLRAPLLTAFDIYRSHVSYKTVVESEERHEVIMAWYRDLLDLKQSALDNVPDEIKPYV